MTMPAEPTDRTHVYNQFVIRVEERDRLQAYLGSHGIPTEVYYPLPLHLEPAFAYLGYKPGDLPYAEQACEEVLALPVFPEMPPELQVEVVNYMAHFYQRSRSVAVQSNPQTTRAKRAELPWISTAA
jgi:dTDP-4-amino-4,6-dideoxygalactose transaminase